MRSLIVLSFAGAALGQRPLPQRHFLVNREVVTLAKAGFSEPIIIDTVRSVPNRFDVTTDALVALASQGLSERVIGAMVAAEACGPRSDLAKVQPVRRRSGGPEAEGRWQMTGLKALFALATLLPGFACAQIGITTTELPNAARGVHYRATIGTSADGRCPSGDVTLSVADGRLPNGLELRAFWLEGVPREIGRFVFVISAHNACAAVGRTFELVVTGRPILEVTSGDITFKCGTSAGTCGAKTVLVSSTWPGLAYTADVEHAPWLRVKPARGMTPETDSALTGDAVRIEADPGKLTPGTYRGSVIFWTRDGANTPEVQVVLVVRERD